MKRIIAALLLAISSLSVPALAANSVEAGAPPEVAANAPDRHVVVPGDTLWGIARTFLKDPFRWNELWQINPDQIKNPHRIYPGQVIVLDRSGAQPRLRIEGEGEPAMEKLPPRIRETSLAQQIPAIPQQAIEPFLIRPLVVDEVAVDTAPRIVAVQDGRVLAGNGDTIYAVNLDKAGGKKWQIYRPGVALKDPDTGEVLGYSAEVVGSAVLLREGDPAALRITASKNEIGKGDQLAPEPKSDIFSYPLHPPKKPISARIVGIAGDAPNAGRYSVILISRGRADGVELGDVLALYRPGETMTDRHKGVVRDLATPEERFGLIYVFRVFDRISYALIMESDRPAGQGDVVRTP
ncbi:MAG: LysM peptidoglycan-binding domain-containing protein [Rhodocyclaceae bacterium]|nr:LysM peptidoglycan-binding domain-containing protein [Rhodocyclaceae bacterium]